jgi:prepilin-type N-terminal cleavage/methylation domain-containing protein
MKKAFTLTEMLVTIALIVILVGILLPVASQSKGKAEETVCVSNLRQIHAALKLYQADHDEYPPNVMSWPGFVPYYKTMLTCPASKQQYREYDYVTLWSPLGASEEFPTIDQSFLECRAIRGSDMPLVWDMNHLNMTTNEGIVILLRDSGTVNTLKWISDPEGPCHLEPGIDFPQLNF